MLKVILGSFLILSALSPQAFSQQAPAKVLIVVHSGLDDIFGFGTSILRAIDLKKSGVTVQVVFEGESVLYFLGKDFTSADPSPAPPPGPKRPRGDAVDGSSVPAAASSTPTAAPATPEEPAPAPAKDPGSHTRRSSFNAITADGEKLFSDSMAEFEAAGIPYTVCSWSAKFLGKYDKLKKLGRPLSKDTTRPVAITTYVKEGYQVISY